MRRLACAEARDQEYLDLFFRRIATAEMIKQTFVDGCPPTRPRV